MNNEPELHESLTGDYYAFVSEDATTPDTINRFYTAYILPSQINKLKHCKDIRIEIDWIVLNQMVDTLYAARGNWLTKGSKTEGDDTIYIGRPYTCGTPWRPVTKENISVRISRTLYNNETKTTTEESL